MSGMGAGDVKALAALGAWLGPQRTFFLFVYMGICGGLLILLVLGWRGTLWFQMRQCWVSLGRLFRRRPPGKETPERLLPKQKMPYAVALALGMAVLYWHGPMF